jgi:hypothetical protein
MQMTDDTAPHALRFDAFISYSRRDGAFARVRSAA